jgi:hypothetical protein
MHLLLALFRHAAVPQAFHTACPLPHPSTKQLLLLLVTALTLAARLHQQQQQRQF